MWNLKKHKSLKNLNIIDHKWSIIHAKMESNQYHVRINTTAKEWCAHPELSLKIGFAVPCDPHNDTEQLNQIEEAIEKLLCDKFICIPVLIITGENFREFVYYATLNGKSDEMIGVIHNDIHNKFNGFNIQCAAEIDKKWVAYNSFN